MNFEISLFYLHKTRFRMLLLVHSVKYTSSGYFIL